MSSRKVWWKCSKEHEWETLVSARTGQKQNCPYCANKKACLNNCLATKYPEISKEWDQIKNGLLTPKDVLPHSRKKIWWICPNDHSWSSWLSDRTSSHTRCTQCLGYSIRDRKEINTQDGYRVCKYCRKELSIGHFRNRLDKRDNRKRLDNACIQCASDRVEDYRKTDRGIAAEIVRRTKHICKKNGLPFDLDKCWVFQKLNSIDWNCELTGLPMIKNTIGGFTLNSISVDRIRPGQGYTKDNIRFVLNQVNIFRQNGTDAQMYMISEALLKYRK